MSKEKTKLKPLDAPVYHYYEALYRCFYSRQLYVDVGKRWRGLGLMYLLLAVLLSTIPLSLRIGHQVNANVNQRLIEPLKLLPTMYVQNGVLSLDKPMPYFIKNKHDDVVAIIDTTNHITEFTKQFPELSVLINKESISFKIPTTKLFNIEAPNLETDKPVTESFEKNSNFVFDGKQLVENKSIKRIQWLPNLLIYPMVVSSIYSLFLVFFLVFGFLGQLYSRIFFSFKMTVMQSCRLFMVAGTPSLFLLMLCFAMNLFFMGLGFILLIALFVYYSIAVYALKAKSRGVVFA